MTWPLSPLKDVATLERSSVVPGDIPDGTPYVGLEHISRDGRISGYPLAGDVEILSNKFRFTEEHVLFGKLRPNLGKIARPGFSGVCSTDILPIRPGPRLDANYLRHYLAQPRMVAYSTSRAAGANLPRLSPTVLADIPIPVPPLEEQRRIAAILDEADALRALRRRATSRLGDLAQSVFVHMFGDLDDDRRQALPRRTLGAVCEAVIDCPHSTPQWTESGEVCLRTSNLTRGGWNWADKRFVSAEDYMRRSARGEALPGDIILSREGTVGVAAIVEPGMRVCMGQRLVQVRSDGSLLQPEYLLGYLLEVLAPERIRKFMVGSTSRHLNVKDLRALSVPLPPLELQREYGRHVEQLTTMQTTHRRFAFEADSVLEAAQALAFAGGDAL